MANAVTLGTLKERSLDLADQSLGYIDADRLLDYINAEASELYDLLIASHSDYFLKQHTFTLVSGTEAYTLPTDFYKSLKMYKNEGSQRIPMARFSLEEIDNGHVNSTTTPTYRIMGDSAYFTPESAQLGTVTMFYIPAMTLLADDLDPISFAIPQLPLGWEDYIVYGAAARMAMREESDPSPYLAGKQRVQQKLVVVATDRDEGRPNRIQNVRRSYRRGYWD